MFFAFEGIDGSGKSTQAARLNYNLPNSVLFREPGTTSFGEHCRAYLKSNRPLCLEAELLMFEAARAQLVQEGIRPAIEHGMHVVCDRYAASTRAYQGWAQGVSDLWVVGLNDYATGGLYPHMNFLLDVDPVEGLRRAGRDNEGHKFEDKGLEFQSKVREGYLRQAHLMPRHWTVIDGSLPEDEIAEMIWSQVCGLIES